MDVGLLTTLLVGAAGGLLAGAVLTAWFRRRAPLNEDLDELVATVEAQGRALRKLTMQRLRSGAVLGDRPTSPSPEPGAAGQPSDKAALRARVFGSKMTPQ